MGIAAVWVIGFISGVATLLLYEIFIEPAIGYDGECAEGDEKDHG